MGSGRSDDYLPLGALVLPRRRIKQDKSTGELGVIIKVVPPKRIDLGANEMYDCYFPDGLVERYFRHQIEEVF